MNILNVVVDGEEQLIRYKTGVGGQGGIVYTIETSIPNAERFQVIVTNGNALYLRISPTFTDIIKQIVKQIEEHEKSA